MASLIFASSHSLLLCSWLFVLFLHGESFTAVTATNFRFPHKVVVKYGSPLDLASTPLCENLSRARKLGLRRMQEFDDEASAEFDDEASAEFDDEASAEFDDEASADYYDEDDNEPKKGHVDITTELELPFPASVAFDAFADLPRQPSWSPWLHSVSYIDPPSVENRETKWKLRYLGVRLSWNAINTQFVRPNVIEWKSTKGMKNFGRVDFSTTPGREDFTLMKMTLTFVVPGPVGRIFKKSDRIKGIVKKRMLEPTLTNFCAIVMENDMQQKKMVSEPLPLDGL
jgi:uncharacterized membrane protein